MGDDPHQAMVDRIAEALGLERIGWIFTSLILDDMLLVTPAEVLTMGRLQHENSTDIHFTKYRLSKFVSCAIRPDPNAGGSPALNPFMISDQCTSMVRDGILNDNADRKHCVVREAQKNELLPDFLVEGKPSKKVLTDFFVVRVNDTAPKKHQRMFTHADFPRENRQTHPQRRDDIKKYFKKIPPRSPLGHGLPTSTSFYTSPRRSTRQLRCRSASACATGRRYQRAPACSSMPCVSEYGWIRSFPMVRLGRCRQSD